MPEIPSSPWLDTRQAAAYLGLRPSSLRTFRSLGKGPRYHRAGGAVRYHVDDLDAYVRGEAERPCSRRTTARPD